MTHSASFCPWLCYLNGGFSLSGWRLPGNSLYDSFVTSHLHVTCSCFSWWIVDDSWAKCPSSDTIIAYHSYIMCVSPCHIIQSILSIDITSNCSLSDTEIKSIHHNPQRRLARFCHGNFQAFGTATPFGLGIAPLSISNSIVNF